MAKVKNQVYDGSEECYREANGTIHYLGDFIRHTVSAKYPYPSFRDWYIVRKTPRVKHPTWQGRGSAKQRPWRDCFKACCDQWDAMPDECPEIGPCPTITSKGNMWDAKQAQGVMCSYFDLFMGCCLSSCTEISVTGPDGVTYTGGVIPEDTNCWPCPSPCRDSVLSIAYTTAVMGFGESQALHAHDSAFGDDVPCCLPEELEWRIVSGGGFLNPSTGLTTTYLAPDSNPTCEDSPVIELTDCCGRSASLSIAVTHQDAQHAAYYIDLGVCVQECHQGIGTCYGSAVYSREYFDCLGVHIPELDVNPWYNIGYSINANCGEGSPCDTMPPAWCAANPHPYHVEDLRTPQWIADGCCPEIL